MGISVIEQAVSEYRPSHIFALFSGGHDSLCSTHLASTFLHPAFSGVIHCNTGIGIPETTEFVRETCAANGWPLYEYHARIRNGMPIYDDMCLRLGMPGGEQAHRGQYHTLKAESLYNAFRQHRQGNASMLFVTGIRKQESGRRMRNPIAVPTRRDRKYPAIVWVCPILEWSALDCTEYIAAQGLKRNPVVDKLHRSGECLCGALARPDEIKEIAVWYPEVAARIHALEEECFKRGLPSEWGSRKQEMPPAEQLGMELCQSCETRWDVLRGASL